VVVAGEDARGVREFFTRYMIGHEYKNRATEPLLAGVTREKAAEGVVGVGYALVVARKPFGQQVAVGVGPRYDIHGVLAFGQALLQPLGHAADDADKHPLPAAAQAPQLGQTAPDALLGIVADRAGIDQDDVRLPGIVGVAPPFVLHDRHDDLRIADVHLAAVGLYEQFFTLPL